MLVMNGYQKNNLLLVKKIVRYLPKIITVNYKNNQVLYKQLKKSQIHQYLSIMVPNKFNFLKSKK